MAQEQESARELRVRLGISQTAGAADAGLAPNTFRVAELDRSAVSPKNRAKYDAFVARLRDRASKAAA